MGEGDGVVEISRDQPMSEPNQEPHYIYVCHACGRKHESQHGYPPVCDCNPPSTSAIGDKQGPNVNKLIIHKMSADAVPPGGGLADSIKFLTNKEAIISGARKATEFVKLAIQAVREAAEPNEFKNADDETIAAELLKQIEARLSHAKR